MENKLKIVWLCHFANEEIKEYFKNQNIKELAPWISNLIEIFKNNNYIELYIIAPNIFNNSDVSIKLDSINYYFYKHRSDFYSEQLHSIRTLLFPNDLSLIKNRIKLIVDNIKPDIIHLHGAENPYYSAGILKLIDSYTVLTTIQGFARHISLDGLFLARNYTRSRIKIEEEILKKCLNFGTRTKEMNETIQSLNKNANLFFHNYPITLPLVFKTNHGIDEPIDCVFFARVCKEKGIEDLIEAIAIVKLNLPNIKVQIIGDVSKKYYNYLYKKCVDLKVEKNFEFLGFLKSQFEIYEKAMNTKMYVLPTYHDVIPGTIIESMFLKLPVIAYAVGGIPSLNDEENAIILVKKFDIKTLANSILSLYNNTDKRIEMSKKAFNVAKNKFDKNEIIKKNLLDIYKKII